MAPYMQQTDDGSHTLPDNVSIMVQLDSDLRDNDKNHKFHRAKLLLFNTQGPVSRIVDLIFAYITSWMWLC